MPINNQMASFLLIIVMSISIASGLSGCVSGGIKSDNGETVSDESSILSLFKKGEIRLTCGTSCSGSWGSSLVEIKSLYSQSRWKDIVLEIAKIGFDSDVDYFYLGRAAEELGYFDAALTYYQLALSSSMKCAGLFNNCNGFSFPSDIDSEISFVQRQIERRKTAEEAAKSTIRQTSNILLSEAVTSAISTYSLNEIKKHIATILDAIKTHDDAGINAGVAALNQIAHPPHGNRKKARAENVKGLAAIREGSFNEAVSFLSAAVRTDPADQEIIDNLSFALQKSSRFQEARFAAECALSLAPTRASAWANLGTVLAQENKEESAVASFMLAFRFSTNQLKTREYFKGLVDGDAPSSVKQAAANALNLFGMQ